MNDCCIQVKNLTKKFNHATHEALSNINLTIYQKDIYGIIGMSGAGKSTLMRCLTTLDRPNEGSIFIENENISTKHEKELILIRQKMGMIFQHFHLFASRTVGQNIAYPLEIQGISVNEQQKRVNELLSLVGLEEKKDSYPAQLSGGEKQRVGIARALATQPSLLFCDEPTSALDPKTARSILQLLYSLNQQLGLTIVMITHQLEAVKQICNRVAVLSKGLIVEEGEVKQVFTRPEHPITRHLLHLGIEQVPPDLILNQNANTKLVRLGFEGNQAKQPIISQLIKQHHVDVNILSGNLDYLQSMVIGNLIVELSGSSTDLNQAIQFLQHQQVYCEVLS